MNVEATVTQQHKIAGQSSPQQDKKGRHATRKRGDLHPQVVGSNPSGRGFPLWDWAASRQRHKNVAKAKWPRITAEEIFDAVGADGEACKAFRVGAIIARFSVEDLALVVGHRWRPCGGKWNYLTASAARIVLHRLILPLSKPFLVDHKNGDRFDNRRSNLRPATTSQNIQNQKPRGRSRFLGVSWEKNRRRWQAQIQRGKKIALGAFLTEEAAARAYDAAARRLFGPEARVNFA